ncbi:WD40/YVTN/BNR-like repeat-containing protein [Micromonospora sp. WMMD558]|uniref:WD40/YVTN/BNR-like repeat-containing protein n=1 Tax=Micromonospora sp. WMMD558 TaxID=3403462 RepID=UPI003BF498D4
MIERRLPWLVALVPMLAACSIGDIRRDPPSRTAPIGPSAAISQTPGPPPTAVAVAETRRVQVAVPEGYDRPYVEFVDASHGYALFASCGERPPGRDCPALLYATTDGGRSWRKLRHPRPVADNQQVYVATGVLALLSEPYGWWASTDGGRTFRHTRGEAGPVEWRAAQGRFQIVEAEGGVGRWDGAGLDRLPVQPGVRGLNTVGESRGLLAAAGAAGGLPYAAVSTDGGRSWRATPVPAPATGDVNITRVEVAPDGELWLIGERPDRRGFPALWRWAGSWQPVRAEGHPERVAPPALLGGGRAAVVSSRGAGVVAGGRYTDVPWPVSPEHYLRILDDGTLTAAAPKELLLARPPFTTWTRVVLEAA